MMKNFKLPLYIRISLYAVVVFGVLWYVWYHYYYYSMMWLEGYSFFSTLPDTTFLSAVFPYDTLKYIGAFLLQFYYYPVVGAALQAFYAVVIMLCAMTIVVRLFAYPSRSLWLATVPVPFFVGAQFWDTSLIRSLTWIVVFMVVAAVVYGITLRKCSILRLPSFLANVVVEVVAVLLILFFSVYNLGYKDSNNHVQEYFCKLEYLADTRQWDALLEIATPEKSQHSDIVRRFALLALIEKGVLNEQMFLYGVTSRDDFYFKDRDEPLCRSFNALFFRSLGMPNEMIHQTFQQQIQSNFGTCFTVLRRLAETNLETKNYVLAKKYMDILSHSTVMKGWVEKRKPQLEAIRNSKPVFEAKGEQFYTADVLVVAAAMHDRYPSVRKYADILLCGLLAERNGDEFYPAFKVIAEVQYSHGERIPHYYEEALMLIAPKEPEVLQKYTISRDVQDAFQNVMQLVNNGEIARMKSLCPNSFWAYFF